MCTCVVYDIHDGHEMREHSVCVCGPRVRDRRRRQRGKRCAPRAASRAGLFTETSPLRVHFLRWIDDSQLRAMRARLHTNVHVTCVSEAMHQLGLDGKASVRSLLPPPLDNVDEKHAKRTVDILVEGNLSPQMVADVLDAASPPPRICRSHS